MYSAPYAADSDSIANTAVKAALLDKLCIDIITRFFLHYATHIRQEMACIPPCVTYELHSYTVLRMNCIFCCFCCLLTVF